MKRSTRSALCLVTMLRQAVWAVVICMLTAIPAAAQDFFVVELPPMPDETSSSAADINNYGHIVGTWYQQGSATVRGYYYDGQKHDLGPDVVPTALSDNGYVTGYYTNGVAFLYLRSADTFEDLGTLGGATCKGYGVNNLGEVTGESDMPSGPDHAFVFSGGVMIDLGVPQNTPNYAADYTKGNGLNDDGLVVGEALIGYGGDYWAIPFIDSVHSGSSMMKIEAGTWISGSAWAVNELGHVVGWTSTNEDLWGDAFVFDGVHMTSLGSLSGTSYSIANAVNDADEIIGYSFGEWVWQDWCGCLVWVTNIYHPFYYADGSMVDINTMLPEGTSGTITVPTDINNSGKILTPIGGKSSILVPVVTGDGDDDGDLDLFDYADFLECVGGPNQGPPSTPGDCIRLFDFDLDYDVDLVDFGRLQVLMAGPGIIGGTVAYDGSDVGDVYVTATSIKADGFTYTALMPDPGDFEVPVYRSGHYDVTAFIDVNGNATLDADEPFAPSLENPVYVDGEGGFTGDIVINLGPYEVSGWVGYEDGTPVGGILISLTGTHSDSTTSSGSGSYVLDDVLRGDYTVTPSDPGYYFYPFDQTFTLKGADYEVIDFIAHDFPTGEVDGQAKGIVSSVSLEEYSITINEDGVFTTVYVYAGTVYSGAATSLEEVTVGHAIEAQFYTSNNLADHIDTDPAG